MTTETNNDYQFENLSSTSRIVRLTVSTLFMAAVLSASVPAAGLASLTYLSIYLVMTAIMARDPVSTLFSTIRSRVRRVSGTPGHLQLNT